MSKLYAVTATGYATAYVYASSQAEAFDKAADLGDEDWEGFEWDRIVDAEPVDEVA